MVFAHLGVIQKVSSTGVKYILAVLELAGITVHRSTARVIRLALLELAVTQHHTIRHICQFRNSHLVIGGLEKISGLVMEVWIVEYLKIRIFS